MKQLLLLLLVSLSIQAFPQFNEIQFYPNDSVYKRALSFNGSTIYCLGNLDDSYSNKYELYKSDDEGLSWSFINYTEQYLNTANFVSFSDSVHISIGKHTIVKTNNAFDSIDCIICNFSTYPTSIKAVNKDTILIFDKGNLYVSYDGFNNWDTVTINSLTTKHDFAEDEISIINDSVWIAYLNKDCALIKTTNAGTTWKLIKDLSVYSFCDNYIYANFSTENIGLLRIEKTIYISIDGATTFQEALSIRKKSEFIEMNSFSSGWTYVVTNNPIDSNNTIYYSKNFGTTWDSLIYSYNEKWDQFYNLDYYNDSIILALSYTGKLFKIEMSSVGINNVVPSIPVVKIYPNPSIDIINIDIEGVANWHYSIYDQFGRLIQQRTFKGESCKVDISSYTKGLYYIEVTDLKSLKKITKKIIKL